MNLSYQRALWAAYTILDMLFDENDRPELRFILSDMSPFTFKDRTCADPALWQSWIDCSKSINDTGFLTFEQVMPTLVDFLKINESEYSCFEEEMGAYSADAVANDLSRLAENGCWEEVLNKVLIYDENDTVQ